MTAPFTDLGSLAGHLRGLVAAGSPITLDATILAPSTVTQLATAYVLPKGAALTVSGVAAADVPDPSGNLLTISTGTAPVLNVPSCPVELMFSMADDTLELVVSATLPDGWTFADSFADLDTFPFTDLTVTGARFVFGTIDQPAYPWPGDGASTIDLGAGQNFLSEVGLGGVSLIATLLGSMVGTHSLRFYGPFAPTDGQLLPVGTLTAQVGGTAPFSIGSAPYTLSLANPRVAVQIGSADADTNPVQDVDLLVLGDFQQTLQVSLAIPATGGSYTVSTTPLPGEGSVTSLIEALPGGAGFTDYIPSELSSIFNEVGLDNFTMVVDATPVVTYLGLSISTLQVWPLITGVLELEGLNLVVEVVDPSGLNWTQVLIAAQAKFLQEIFPGEFDFTVGLQKQDVWEVSTVTGRYLGAVNLGDLVGGLLGDQSSVPSALRDITFANFALVATRAAIGDPFTYTCYGTVDVSFPVLDTQLTAQLNLTFNKPTTGYSIVLTGVMVIGEEAFTLTLDLATAGSRLNATWESTGDPLDLGDLATALGWTGMPAIPASLDLALTRAGISYDFTAGALVLTARSRNYGNAVFLSVTAGGAREFYFLLSDDSTFSLSQLPLVGAELGKIESIAIGDIVVFIGSQAVAASEAASLNQVLAVGPNGYPSFPASGFAGTVMLSATLDFGSETLPLSLSLGGAGAAPASSVAAEALAAPPVAAESSGNQVTSTTTSGGVTWFTIQKSFGPVSIQRIGASYQSATESLWFEMDATMAFGPLTFTLAGLGVGSPLSTFAPRFDLQGLGLSYSNPPLELAGLLVNLAPPGADYIAFEGGITISTGDFTVTAFGYYGNQGGFTSLFIFADVAYDFGGPPAFFVTGIALGFGYNSQVRMPTVEQVATFPFIAALPTSTFPGSSPLTPSTTPQKALDTITNPPPWVTPVHGSFWGAAGITFTSFELVNSQALLVIDAGSQLTIGLLGTSRARQFPQVGDVTYANIELDLMAEFAPAQGVFFIEALLAASSFVLDKACVLTGGIAFYVWFGSSPYRGDFVFTVGGYNPGFVPPPYYPSVPRVGFHWALDSTISISGGAYLAVTPAALMVGGDLNATYQSGNLKAWFDAHADVIIRWKPFWFDADIGISIGASYKLHLFGTHTFSVELGCDLEFWGPPTGGKLHASWYVISFTIAFGAPRNPTQSITGWSDVEAMLPNSAASGPVSLVSVALTAGAHPGGTAPAQPSIPAGTTAAGTACAQAQDASAWVVRAADFAFRTSTPIPATTVTVGTTHRYGPGASFSVYPLVALSQAWKAVTATHVVTIVNAAGTDCTTGFSATPISGGVPASLWGQPPEDSKGNPQVPSPTSQVVPSQMVGVTIVVTPPVLGSTSGPVTVASALSADDLALTQALLPLGSPQPSGELPVNSEATVGTIADPGKGIAASPVVASRDALFASLSGCGYAPAANDDMARFSQQIGCALAGNPLLVQGSTS